VSDTATQSVYQVSPITGAQHTLSVGTLQAPAGLTVDPSGNLLITDPGAGAVYRYSLQSGANASVSSTAVKPSAIVTDAAGNLLVADSASILAVPASANSAPFTVASLTPSALAIDGAGNLYTGSGGSVLKLTRTQGYVLFASATASSQTVSLLESGNEGLQLSSIGQSDTADYSLTASGSADCMLNGALPATVAVGGACSLTATFTATTFANPTDTATFNGNLTNAALSTPSSVQLVLTGLQFLRRLRSCWELSRQHHRSLVNRSRSARLFRGQRLRRLERLLSRWTAPRRMLILLTVLLQLH
jgi:hypothetical protein